MGYLWILLRVFWVLGLLFVVPLCGFVWFGAPKNKTFEIGVFGFGALYIFGLGYLILSVVPRLMKGSLNRLKEPFLRDGFRPTYELYSQEMHRYIGFDHDNHEVLYLEKGHCFRIPTRDVTGWEVVSKPNTSSGTVVVYTKELRYPALRADIGSSQTTEWIGRLQLALG